MNPQPKSILALNRSSVVSLFGVNEVWTFDGGGATGGHFHLIYDSQTSAAIDYNATTAVVQAAFEALSSVGAGNARCTGGPAPGAIVIEFIGDLAATNTSDITITDSTTGGTGATVTKTHAGGTTGLTTSSYKMTVPTGWEFTLRGTLITATTAIVKGSQYGADGPVFEIYRTPSGGAETLLHTTTLIPTTSGIGVSKYDPVVNSSTIDNVFSAGDILEIKPKTSPGPAAYGSATGAVNLWLFIDPRNG